MKKVRIPDLMESAFDISYLAFDVVAGIVFFVKADGKALFILYGLLAWVLGAGDAFHLIPRVRRAFFGNTPSIQRQLGIGLQISSISMTVFYVLLLYIWANTFPTVHVPNEIAMIIWGSALLRIIICLLPQNDWCGGGNIKLSVLRNAVFLITGFGVILLYMATGNSENLHMERMIIAIIISFGCYLPVTLWSKKKPIIGMLMIPKTCAYIWMIAMGLGLIARV